MRTTNFFFSILLFFVTLHLHAQTDKKNNSTITQQSSEGPVKKVRALTSGTIYLNLSLTITGPGYIDIPVSFVSTDSIVSLDFALKYNDSVLSYQSINSTAAYLTDALAKYSPDDKTLRFTSNSHQYYKVNQTIVIVRFNTLSTKVINTDLFGLIGYLNGDRVNMELKGNFPYHHGSLKFWSDNSPIQYNANDPDHYLITNIYGVDSNCSNKSAVAVQPDLNGEFVYQIQNGPSIKIERDILPATDVQPVINGFDVSLGHKILVNDLTFIPNIYQVIALDVNADGVVSAGDISQINQRSVKTITEFKQKWNYNNNGTSNGQLSKDWLFVDSTSLANPAYHISSTYPSSDGIGYSKSNVPVISFCLQVPGLNSNGGTSYTGILLGDANGNYAAVANDGKIKRVVTPKK